LAVCKKTTLIDFPGRVACTVFTVGCNFRCPFCHNKDLVTQALFRKSKIKPLSEEYFFDFLKKRRKILDGVCITGGEPTIWPDLPQFCRRIKDLDLEVKLDSNGSHPDILKKLFSRKLIDFIAMDIKAAFADYSKAIGVKNSKLVNRIKKSIKIIIQSGLEYEFRTTVVPSIHDKESLIKLAKQLKALSSKYLIVSTNLHYSLQSFRPKNCLQTEFLQVKPFSTQEMREILKAVQKTLPKTKLKGE